MSVLSQLRKRCFTSQCKGIKGSTPYPDWVFGSIGQNVLSPVLVGPILRLKCMDAQCISNTTRVCLKAMEKHFFLLQTRKTTAAHAAQDQRRREPPGTAPSRCPKWVRRRASPAPLPWQGPAAGTKSPVFGRPLCAPRSRPVNPGAQAPGVEKDTTASRKPTGAPTATGPNRARRTNAGPQGTQRGTPPATTKARGQVPSNNCHRGPQTRAARRTRNEPRHRNRCQATPNPHTRNPSQDWRGTGGRCTPTNTPQDPSQEWRGATDPRAQAHTPTPRIRARIGGPQAEHRHKRTHPNIPARSGRAQPKPEPKHTHPHRTPRT